MNSLTSKNLDAAQNEAGPSFPVAWLQWLSTGVLTALIISGCAHQTKTVAPGSPRFEDIKDSGPDQDIDVSGLQDAIPQVELIRGAGNKTPYEVLGRTYHVNFDTVGFVETGHASWYGKKFHGRKTSNGEVYDMFGMTAAHKHLPIPSYVKVTNLENGKSVVVRINDRGPFHGDRIIDLSYAAAKKLGYHQQGTAKVRIEYMQPKAEASQTAQVKSASGAQRYLQAGAFRSRDSAQAVKSRVASLTDHQVRVHPEPKRNLYKVLIGPILDDAEVLNLHRLLQQGDLGVPHLVEM